MLEDWVVICQIFLMNGLLRKIINCWNFTYHFCNLKAGIQFRLITDTVFTVNKGEALLEAVYLSP